MSPPSLFLISSNSHPVLLLLSGLLLGVGGCTDRPIDEARARVTTDTTAPQQPAAAAPAGVDLRPAAERLVSQSARVRAGDVVVLSGGPEDLALFEDVAVEVAKRGGHPLITLTSERLRRRLFDEVPAKYDSITGKQWQKLLGAADVYIFTESMEGRTLKGVPAARRAARQQADIPILEIARKRKLRGVFLGNGLYPSAEGAEQFGLSRDELARLMFGGIDVDYTTVQETGTRMRAVLARARELRITSPNGTDLRIGIAGRPVHVSDGIISPEDERRGDPATSVWLPAGEVYLTPQPGTAEGILVGDADFFQGEPLRGLRLEIKGGKVAKMTAETGLPVLEEQYSAAGAGRDLVSVVDIGINPGLRIPEGKPVHAWSRAGLVTIVIGNNLWAGGNNATTFGMSPYLARATVTVDGTPLVRDGRLVEEELAAGR